MKKLTQENCKLLIKNRPYVVIKFGANWCKPCSSLSKSMEDLEIEFPQIDFLDIDVAADLDYAAEMGVISIPAVFFTVHGEFIKDNHGKNLRTSKIVDLKSILKKMIEKDIIRNENLQ